MNLFDSFRMIIKRIFGVDPVSTDTEVSITEENDRKYRELVGYNLTAIFAGRLATLTVTDSTVEVTGGNQRSVLINEAMNRIWTKAPKWVSTAYGTGGVLLIPYVISKRIYIDIVPQSSMLINRVNGDELRAVSIVADSTVRKDERFFRWTDYSLDNTGLLTIRQRATNSSGVVYPLESFDEWADVTEEMTISGLEHLPLAYIKNPTDNRETEALYGVPVTYGCSDKMKEIGECLADIHKEYKLKKPMVGMDSTLFEVKNGRRQLPVTGLFMPVTPRGLDSSGKLWEVYDPSIRDTAYYSRRDHLFEELEKQVGTSRGILTEPTSRGATATEIKAANYYTYAIITNMRKVIEQGLDRLAYAFDVLANAYSLSPMGEYELSFDWSYDLIESSQESFNQLLSSVTVDAAEPAEVRLYNHPEETLEEAREHVAEIKAAKADLADEIMKQALAAEAMRNPVTDDNDEA